MQSGIVAVVVDGCPDEDAQSVIEIFWQAARQSVAQQLGSSSDVRVHQRMQDRVFVRKVLVQRADRQLGVLGDAVGRPGGIAVRGENVSCRIQYPLPGLRRPILLGLLPRLKSIRWGHGVLLGVNASSQSMRGPAELANHNTSRSYPCGPSIGRRRCLPAPIAYGGQCNRRSHSSTYAKASLLFPRCQGELSHCDPVSVAPDGCSRSTSYPPTGTPSKSSTSTSPPRRSGPMSMAVCCGLGTTR